MNDFSDRLIRILNHGALNLALGIGYSHGVFDVLDAQDTPVSLETLAELTGLDKRYLREWLGNHGHRKHHRHSLRQYQRRQYRPVLPAQSPRRPALPQGRQQ